VACNPFTSGTMRRGGMVLLLLALVTRAMVPAGWMPSTASFGLMLCNGAAAMPSFAEITRQRSDGVPFEIALARAAIARAEGKTPAQPAPEEPHPCPFAAIAAVLPAPTLDPIILPTGGLNDASVVTSSVVAVGRGLAAPPPPATGPPLHA